MTAQHNYFSTAPQILRRSAVSEMTKGWTPRTTLGLLVRRALPNLPADLAGDLLDAIKRSVVIESSLSIRVLRGYGAFLAGGIHSGRDLLVEDYGVVSRKLVTDTGVAFIVDAFQNITEIETFKYHALGTGVGAEAAANTALGTELTTEYTGNVRATGTTIEGASANIYRTVATNTLDSGTPAVTEHGIFSASSAGTLLDRSVFSAINLIGANGDGLSTTYDLTVASGG